MTYWALNAIFFGAVAVIALVSVVLRRPPVWVAMLACAAVLLVMTVVFDNVMIGVGLVGYNESLISGALVGVAPLEDFAYTAAVVVLLPSLWSLLGARREHA